MNSDKTHHHGTMFDRPVRNSGTLSVLIIGGAALIWVIVRLIPRPSRAAYPCMQVALSLAAGFVSHMTALAISACSLLQARQSFRASRYWLAMCLTGLAVGLPVVWYADTQPVHATHKVADHVPNQPLGKAAGIFPGRVAWVHDPAATNEACEPTRFGHGWFLSENNDQGVIDRMLSDALRAITDEPSDSIAWDAIFRYHNQHRGKGNVGYEPGERIFLKINATSSWAGNISPWDYSIVNNESYGISETSPHLVLSVLRQLVYEVGVQQDDIWIGDPLRHIYKHCSDLWYPEFPGVHYLDHDGWNQREKVVPSQTAVIRYSDRGSILRTGSWDNASAGDPVTEDHLYTVFEETEYLINIPTLKGHKHAGMTAFPKNHFGSHTRDDAKHLHGGLVAPEAGNPRRQGYGLYRVQVDLMGHTLLGGKNLLYVMDGLWTSDFEVDGPDKWLMPPFNNDWMSSLFVSLDPVAIESVGFDFLRSEFTPDRGLATYPQMEGVDDYLHQAADSTTWPPGILYDPEEDGTVLPSLGTHEHWNNPQEKQYSRNLGIGEGIELVNVRQLTGVSDDMPSAGRTFRLSANYPNPFNASTVISYEIPEALHVSLKVYDLEGREVATLVDDVHTAGIHAVRFTGTDLATGLYVVRFVAGSYREARKLVLLR